MHQKREQVRKSDAHRSQLEDENHSLRAELMIAEERKSAALRQAEVVAKQLRDKLIIAAAFVAGALFLIGILLGYRFGHRVS